MLGQEKQRFSKKLDEATATRKISPRSTAQIASPRNGTFVRVKESSKKRPMRTRSKTASQAGEEEIGEKRSPLSKNEGTSNRRAF